MKTDTLIAMLANGPVAADPRLPERRLAAAATVALPLAIVAMLATLGLRPDLSPAAALPMFWLKLLFPASIAVAAYVAVARLARPAGTAAGAWGAVAVALALVWTLALGSLLAAAPGERGAMIFGYTALPCVASVAALSLPIFAATLWTLRTLAPTRPRNAGAAAGLLAGAMAAVVYALHCDEMTLGFLAVWYVLGMTLPAALGALLGPRLLRWA